MLLNFRSVFFHLVTLLALLWLTACDRAKEDVVPFHHLALAPDFFSTPQDTPVQVNFLANDSLPVNARLTVRTPLHGQVKGGGSTPFLYEPATGYAGTDQFWYRVCSGSRCDSALVQINVMAAPVPCSVRAFPDYGLTLQDQPLVMDLLLNDTIDCYTGPLTVTLEEAPRFGTATLTADNKLRYQPNPGYTGPDLMHYRVCRGPVCATSHVGILVRADTLCNPINNRATDDNLLMAVVNAGITVTDTVFVLENDQICTNLPTNVQVINQNIPSSMSFRLVVAKGKPAVEVRCKPYYRGSYWLEYQVCQADSSATLNQICKQARINIKYQ